MKKELEALYKLGEIEFETGDYMNDDGYMMKIESTEMYDILLKSLTPPTADDVCKALSEWLKRSVYYADGKFKIHADVYGLTVDLNTLPPHLITMIGRFYESELENENN